MTTITKWVDCDECEDAILVTGDPTDDFEGWICNKCDMKHNPKDYADMTEEELRLNDLI